MWEPIITFVLLIICVSILFARHETIPIYCKYIGMITISHIVFYSFAAYLMFSKTNNMILFHVLRPLQYVFTAFFLAEVISNRAAKKLVLYSAPIFIIFSISISLFYQNIEEYNSYSIIAYNLLVVLFILIFYRDLLNNPSIASLLTYPAFWISIGLLFYCVGTTVSEGLMNYLIKNHRRYALSFYYIGIVLSFFMYGFIILGFISDKLFKPRQT